MSNDPSPGSVHWEEIARTTLHPVKVLVLDHLAEVGISSPGKMRRKFGLPLPNVSYHVRELERVGLLVLDHVAPVGGAAEHFFRLSEKALIR